MSLTTMQKLGAALARPCPECGAAPGEPCTGIVTIDVHLARRPDGGDPA